MIKQAETLQNQHIGVIGAGAWGTALAIHAARLNSRVTLWCRQEEQAAAMKRDRSNNRYLPGPAFSANLSVTSQIEALEDCAFILLAAPSQQLRAVLERLSPKLRPSVPFVLCAKGIEISSGLLMTEMLEAVLPNHPLAVLSGPTFAIEVAEGAPAAVTLAAEDQSLRQEISKGLASRSFRIYHSDDPIGVEIGGAVKNVIAIACGIVEGRALGDNARAALITRGLAEIMQLGVALGGRAETLSGLSGLGDLTLTCTARQSRNYALGFALGEGQRLEDYMKSRQTVAEGVISALSVTKLATSKGIEMPICEAVCRILHDNQSIDDTIHSLLNRPQKGL